MKRKEMNVEELIEYAEKRAKRSNRLSTFALVLSIIALGFKIFCLFI